MALTEKQLSEIELKEHKAFVKTLGEPIGSFDEELFIGKKHIPLVKEMLKNSPYEHFNIWTNLKGKFIVYGCDLMQVYSWAR